MPGGIYIDDSGGNHFSQAKLDYAAEDADYKREGLRADTDLRLEDPRGLPLSLRRDSGGPAPRGGRPDRRQDEPR